MPIIIAGEHLATFYSGPFFYSCDKPDVEFFRMKAEEFGFDWQSYLEALGRIPVFARDRMKDLMGYYRNMAGMLTVMGLKNLELAREIKERKAVEEALRRSETTLRKIFETIPDQLHIIDRDFRLQHSNRRGGHKYSSGDKRSQNPHCYEAFYKRDEQCENCQALEVFKTGRPVIREKFNPKSGYVEIHSYPVFDASGNVTMAIEHLRDISERRRGEEALRESEQRLSATIQASPIPTFVIGKDLKIIYWNRALEQLSKIKADEVIGSDQAWKAFYGEERPTLANLLARKHQRHTALVRRQIQQIQTCRRSL